jgi:hypothetical protein
MKVLLDKSDNLNDHAQSVLRLTCLVGGISALALK